MKKFFLVISLLTSLTVFISSCLPRKQYTLKKTSEIDPLFIPGSRINYVALRDSDFIRFPFLDTVYEFLQVENYGALQRHCQNKLRAAVTTPDVYLAEIFLLISSKEYSSASMLLSKTKDAFPAATGLLTIDLRIEQQKQLSPQAPVNKFITEYQNLADRYPNDLILKRIIFNRVRFLQYSI